MITIMFLLGAALGFFVIYQFALSVLSLVIQLFRERAADEEKTSKFAVLIPAHNEELLIGNLVASIKRANYPQDLVDVYVIADNCSDRTAEISREQGANCLERFDDEKRGKPYALNWALTQIPVGSYDAVSIIDADTEVDSEYFTSMNNALLHGAEAIQGYFGVLNPDDNWLTRLSVLPAAMRYKLQCPAKEFLGLSCPLAGNGMVFSRSLIEKHGWNAFSIAENWEYYAIVTLDDYVVRHESHAIIYSQVTPSLKEGKAQRTRWLKGRIDTALRYARDLTVKTLRTRRLLYVDALVELLRPSHSMLFLSCILYLVASLVLYLFAVGNAPLLVFAASLVTMLGLTFVFALIVEKAPARTWFALAMVPVYLVWKLLVTLGGILSFRNREWVKTKRH